MGRIVGAPMAAMAGQKSAWSGQRGTCRRLVLERSTDSTGKPESYLHTPTSRCRSLRQPRLSSSSQIAPSLTRGHTRSLYTRTVATLVFFPSRLQISSQFQVLTEQRVHAESSVTQRQKPPGTAGQATLSELVRAGRKWLRPGLCPTRGCWPWPAMCVASLRFPCSVVLTADICQVVSG